MGKIRRIGWVVMDQLETMPLLPRINTGIGGLALARLHWIALRINQDPSVRYSYHVYRPWEKYDGLVFLKSMGQKSELLANHYLEKKKPVVFDANVNYYHIDGTEHYKGMLPTQAQREDAIKMTMLANSVIADSKYIAEQCKLLNHDVVCLPDNVETDVIPCRRNAGERYPLRFVWCGEALKLFELLVIEDVLRAHKASYELIVVTNDLSVMDRWREGYKSRIEKLLTDVDATVRPYHDIQSLFNTYSTSDVVLSPRFLDNSYNKGHTEWKITLAMACGCVAIASPVPSYLEVATYAARNEVTICDDLVSWDDAITEVIENGVNAQRRHTAWEIVDEYYSSREMVKKHIEYFDRLFCSQ